MEWRKKTMTLEQWAPFQERFGEFQMRHAGHPDLDALALFIDSPPGEPTAIYMTGPNIHLMEIHSPEGWEDSPAPSGEYVGLLVGSGNPWERLGVVGRKRNDR